MKREVKGLIFIFALVLSVSLASAFWPFDWIFGKKITGNVVDNTPVENSGKCMDSDGGVYSKSAGEVSYTAKGKRNIIKDGCVPKGLMEYYCNKGNARLIVIDCEKEGRVCVDGACIPEAPKNPTVQKSVVLIRAGNTSVMDSEAVRVVLSNNITVINSTGINITLSNNV